MLPTNLHARLMADAFERVLGHPDKGAMAFVRCLTPEVVKALAGDASFAPARWEVWRVADLDDPGARTITADRAVEMRESKENATLLLVDTTLAGAGMDGIYSAACEVDEASLFKEAIRLAAHQVTQARCAADRRYAEQAIKKARGHGRRFSVSPWTEFDFLVRIAAEGHHPGAMLHLLGLWPVAQAEELPEGDGLDLSRLFVDRLLGPAAAGSTPAQRIEALKLLNPTEVQIADLQRFLRSAATKPLLGALAELSDKRHLWVGSLRLEGAAQNIQAIELVPWRTGQNKIAQWSGLREAHDPEAPPVLILSREPEKKDNYAKLEVRWKSKPDNLEKGACEYRVVIKTDMDEEIASREVSHSGKKDQKWRFTDEDFSMLSDDALINARVVVSVFGNDSVEPQESEEFCICFGEQADLKTEGVGKKVRTFSEGVIELADRQAVSTLADSLQQFPVDSRGFVLLRTSDRGKKFRVALPALVKEVEEDWAARSGQIGRWRVRVRTSGTRATPVEFVPCGPPTVDGQTWERAATASRRMAERLAVGKGVGQIYDDQSKTFDTVVREYLLAWAALLELEEAEPSLALANTVEVQSLSGRTIGLIVLPSHPLRVAWHVAYDNLVLHARFEEDRTPKEIREEHGILDGAMFPAFLPGLKEDATFVFADTLGFHCVGMVPDHDKEPKAAVAILARALGESYPTEAVPTVGGQSARVLGDEIVKYIECHNTSRLLHIHALRAGDGFTVARALGHVQQRCRSREQDETEETEHQSRLAFVLELYPSETQRAVAGRFIAEAREKRRSGAGVLEAEDRWILESLSLPGSVNLPLLRWARRDDTHPKTSAHLALAFDTFDSRVVPDDRDRSPSSRPFFAFGLLSFFEREYRSVPTPVWRSLVLEPTEGEKHPSDRTHTDRLIRLQKAVNGCVSRHLRARDKQPILRTEIPPDKAHSLKELHKLCDWVITLDRNAGIEYFDSPCDNKDIYDAYVIDCVPEREDLGCLQLITSTSNLEEVRNLLDGALDQMGLSHSRRNAEFLMEHLKALSGRLAIHLTGQKAKTSELIALAMSRANCDAFKEKEGDDCWVSLESGFLIPVDDVRDVLPPLVNSDKDASPDDTPSRPDLIYVTTIPRKGLVFRFIEVKYRRHLRAARNPEVLENIRRQVESFHKRWYDYYSNENTCSSIRSIRRAKLARVLHFYADKAQRHGRPKNQYDKNQYEEIKREIDRMIEKGGDYSFADVAKPGRGWIFCPEYAGMEPLEISPPDWETRIFMFGPRALPDSRFRQDDATPYTVNEAAPAEGRPSAAPAEHDARTASAPDAGLKVESLTSTDIPMEQDKAPMTAKTGQLDPSLCLGKDVLTGAEVRWTLTVKGNPHLLVAGLPGMGKTTCLLNLCRQMLEAGIQPIVFSYHQDIDEKLAQLVSSVRFFDFAGLGFNPLQVIDRQSRLAYLDVAGALRDIFVAIFPELGDIQGESIRNAIKQSFIEKGWDDPNADLQQLQEPEFRRFFDILRDAPKPDRGHRSLLARLEELADYRFFDLAESCGSLWDSTEPTVIRIHKTQNDSLQKAFASLVFYKLYKDMFRRGIQRSITHAVVFDEAHRAARLKLIPTMAKECRKYGISLVLASQEARDFHVSLFSAIANYLVLRMTEVDARALIRNVASSDQERALIDKIKQIEPYRALFFSEQRKKPALVALQP